jgi:hypothetical protein
MDLTLRPPNIEDSPRTQDAFPAPQKTPKSKQTYPFYEFEPLLVESPLKNALKSMKKAVNSIATALAGKATTSKDADKVEGTVHHVVILSTYR